MHTTRTGVFLLAGVALAGTTALLLSPLAAQEAQETTDARDAIIASVSMSGDRAALTLSLPDGTARSFRLERGQLFIDGVARAGYEPDGDLESAWRDLLRSPAVFSPEDLAVALREWKPPAGADEVAAEILERALQGVGGDMSAANLGKQIGEQEAMVEGPSGDGVSIAPGLLSVGELSGQLERLHSSLKRLGEDAASADEMLALVVHDSYAIPSDRTIEGDLALLDGELRLGGRVTGNILVLDGTLLLEPSAVVEGDILQVGGDVLQRGGRIDGELLSVVPLHPRSVAPLAVAPEIRGRIASRADIIKIKGNRPGFFGRIYRNFERSMEGLGTVLGWFIGLGVAGLGLVYFARPRLEVVADTARNNMSRSFGLGVAGEVLFFPVSLILCVGVITWLLIPFFLLAVVVALVGGYVAVAHATGEILAARRFRSELLERLRRSNSYYYVLSGLALLLLPFALYSILHLFGGPLSFLRGLTMFAAGLLSWLAVTIGLGAVILSRGGTRTDYGKGYFSDFIPYVRGKRAKEDVA